MDFIKRILFAIIEKIWPTKANEIYWTYRKPRPNDCSINHPHRKLLMRIIRKHYPFKSLLEVGCRTGPNLYLIKKEFPGIKLAGVDINKPSIEIARKMLPGANLCVSEASRLPFRDKSFDILLTDALLIYIAPNKIRKVIKEFLRVTKKAMIFCEWDYPDSKLGEMKLGHWARNYYELLADYSSRIVITKIPEELWLFKGWQKFGYIIEAKI